MGTTVSQMPSVHNRMNGELNGVHSGELLGIPRQNNFADGFQATGELQAQQPDQLDGPPDNPFNGRLGVSPMFQSQQHAPQANVAYDRDETEAAAMAHQQEQRGVTSLSNAVSVAVTNGAQSRHTMAPVSPSEVPQSLLNPANDGPAGSGPSPTPGPERRGPIEFNHAIGYVNKIKVSSLLISTLAYRILIGLPLPESILAAS